MSWNLLSLCDFFSLCHYLRSNQQLNFYSYLSHFTLGKSVFAGILLHYFNMTKSSSESSHILVEVCGEDAQLSELAKLVTKEPKYVDRRFYV